MARNDQLRILVVEDSLVDCALIERAFRRLGRPVLCLRVETPAGLSAALEDGRWAAVMVDYLVPGLRFEDNLALITSRLPGVPRASSCFEAAMSHRPIDASVPGR